MSQPRSNRMTEDINLVIDRLILIDKNFTKFKINRETLNNIQNDVERANIIRNKLFGLRVELNRYQANLAEIIEAKSFVQSKLVYLARNYPLNTKSGRGGMFCPLSDNPVCYYARYRHDVPLSNGYIYDYAGLIDKLEESNHSLNLLNISELDIEILRSEYKLSKSIMAIFPAVITGALGVGAALGVLKLLVVLGFSLPLVAVFPFAIGTMAFGALLGFAVYKAYMHFADKECPAIEATKQSCTITNMQNVFGIVPGKRKGLDNNLSNTLDLTVPRQSDTASEFEQVESHEKLRPVYIPGGYGLQR